MSVFPEAKLFRLVLIEILFYVLGRTHENFQKINPRKMKIQPPEFAAFSLQILPHFWTTTIPQPAQKS